MPPIQSVTWSPDGDAVRIIDQRLLPERLVERDLRGLDEVCEAIATLAVRGAPAIGLAAAMGLVASLRPFADLSAAVFRERLRDFADRLRRTRPTAVNLPWAIDRMLGCAASPALRDAGPAALLDALAREATAMLEEDRAMCRRIGEHGLELLEDGARVLTHCNAGALATGGIGTALAPLYLAAERGWKLEVVVNETRPLLQGSRLTAWELDRAGIPVTVAADHASPALMRAGRIDRCLVGADRIAANGDVANKIGTYAVAIAAAHHGLPFYVAAPTSTVDPQTAHGGEIEIEQRSPDEIRCGFGRPTAPAAVRIDNAAFDVTPASLISAIVTDRGVHRAPYRFPAADR